MKYISTGNPNIFTTSFIDTIISPIPEKNHLWVPEKLPVIDWPTKKEPIYKFIEKAVNSITGENFSFINELKNLEVTVSESDGNCFLNLHLGPTLSFKILGVYAQLRYIKNQI